MKVKKNIITKEDLNTGNFVEVNLEYLDPLDNHIYFPKALKYINETNATIEFLYLSTPYEKSEADEGISEYYEYLEIPAGTTIVDIPKTNYVRLKLTSGVAITDFIMFSYNYTTWHQR